MKNENCDQCKDSWGCVDCKNCIRSEMLHKCTDCVNCIECAYCTGLRNRRYCIDDIQYSRQEYYEKLEERKKAYTIDGIQYTVDDYWKELELRGRASRFRVTTDASGKPPGREAYLLINALHARDGQHGWVMSRHRTIEKALEAERKYHKYLRKVKGTTLTLIAMGTSLRDFAVPIGEVEVLTETKVEPEPEPEPEPSPRLRLFNQRGEVLVPRLADHLMRLEKANL